MRTTLDIDDDVLAMAKEIARAQKKSAGQVMSELARRALITPPVEHQAGYGPADQASSASGAGSAGNLDAGRPGHAGAAGAVGGMAEEQAMFRYELPQFPRDRLTGWLTLPRQPGPPVTPEHVRRIEEAIDLEDAIAFDHDTGRPRVFDVPPPLRRD